MPPSTPNLPGYPLEPVAEPGSHSSSGRHRPLIILAAVVAALLLAYFVVLPWFMIRQYKADAVPKHAAVTVAMTKTYDTFKLPAFTDSNSTTEQDTQNTATARAAVTVAQAEIKSSTAILTGFRPLPGLGWNQAHQKAVATNAAETEYLDKAEDYLAEYSLLIAYQEKLLALRAKLDAAADPQPEAESGSLSALAAKLDEQVAKLQPLTDQAKAIVPPGYLQSGHEQFIQANAGVLALLRQIPPVIRLGNIGALIALSAQLDASVADDKLDRAYIDAIQTKAPFNEDIAKLRQLGDARTADFRSL